MKSNSHTKILTILKCASWWSLVYSQSSVGVATISSLVFITCTHQQSVSIPPSLLKQSSTFCIVGFAYSEYISHKKNDAVCGLFCLLPSLSTMFKDSSCYSMNHSFFFKHNNILFYGCVALYLSLHLLMDICVVSFLAFMNRAAISIQLLVCGWTYVFNSLGYICRIRISGPYGNFMCNFLRNCQTVFKSACTISLSDQQYMNLYFSTLLPILIIVCPFNYKYLRICEVSFQYHYDV